MKKIITSIFSWINKLGWFIVLIVVLLVYFDIIDRINSLKEEAASIESSINDVESQINDIESQIDDIENNNGSGNHHGPKELINLNFDDK